MTRRAWEQTIACVLYQALTVLDLAGPLQLANRQAAERVQRMLEYDPEPPFDDSRLRPQLLGS